MKPEEVEKRTFTTTEFIGKNYLNLHLHSTEAEMGFSFVTIYPTVNFGRNVRIGNFVTIEHFCDLGDNILIGNGVVMRPETKLGDNVKIGHNCVLEGDIEIGDNTIIQTQCHITHGARIGSNVILGPGVIGVNDDTLLHPNIRKGIEWKEKPFRIEDGVRVGAGAVITAGVSVGRNAFIHPGAVLFDNVLQNEILMGNPAKVIGHVTTENRI